MRKKIVKKKKEVVQERLFCLNQVDNNLGIGGQFVVVKDDYHWREVIVMGMVGRH